MSDLRVVYDVTGANLPKVSIPAGVGVALYTTGSGDVPASAAQLAMHPAAVRIDQSPANTPADELADAYDMEANAGTIAGAPGWYRAAKANYDAARRPGQRWPMFYESATSVTTLVNALVAAGITSGPRLWVAHWDLPIADAIAMLTGSGGPFPVAGVQVHNAGLYDVSLFLASWLDGVSRAPAPPPPASQTAVLATVSHLVTSTDGGKTWH